MNNVFYVYMYLDQENVPFYIGKGKDNRYQPSLHLYKDCANRLLKNKIRKVGQSNVRVHFLHTDLSEEDAFYWERYWIKYIGRRDLKEGSLCNLTDGGEGQNNSERSKEYREKMRRANSGVNHPNYGKALSKETKRKISAANSGRLVGRTLSKETRQKMREGAKAMWRRQKQQGQVL